MSKEHKWSQSLADKKIAGNVYRPAEAALLSKARYCELSLWTVIGAVPKTLDLASRGWLDLAQASS